MESPPEIGTLVHIGLHWWAAWSFKDLCISDFWDWEDVGTFPYLYFRLRDRVQMSVDNSVFNKF